VRSNNRKSEVIEFFLAFFLFAVPQAPYVEPMKSLEDCLIEASKRNNTGEEMKDPRAKLYSAEWVCLQVKRVTV
jgi:hypothetical protein